MNNPVIKNEPSNINSVLLKQFYRMPSSTLIKLKQ